MHVFGRDMFMIFDKNKGVRATTASTQPGRPAGSRRSRQVNTFINVGETDYDALLLQVEKRLSRGFSARVSYTLSSTRGNTSAQWLGAINFQAGQDLNLDLNEGPTDFDRRHNFVVSGRALVPYTHGMTFSWVARALSGLPFTLTNNTDRRRSQRHAVRSARGRHLHRRRHDRRRQLHGRGLRRQAQRRARPGLLPARHALRLAAARSAAAGRSTCRPTSST